MKIGVRVKSIMPPNQDGCVAIFEKSETGFDYNYMLDVGMTGKIVGINKYDFGDYWIVQWDAGQTWEEHIRIPKHIKGPSVVEQDEYEREWKPSYDNYLKQHPPRIDKLPSFKTIIDEDSIDEI